MQFSMHGFDIMSSASDIGLFEILKISHGAGGWLNGSLGGGLHRMLKVYLNSLYFQTYCMLFTNFNKCRSKICANNFIWVYKFQLVDDPDLETQA